MLEGANAFSGFAVDDMKKAKEFYTNILGLKVTEAHDAVWLHIGNNKIFIYPKDNHIPATYTILNFPVSDLERTVDELTELGIRFEQYDMPEIKTNAKGIFQSPGIKIAWFKDPAGNILSVLEEK